MVHYKRTTIWENLKRIRTLKKFRKLAERYFDNIDYGSYGVTASENPKAKTIRSQLNLMLERVKKVLLSVEVSPEICQASRPTAPELEEGAYLVENIFNLHQLKISPQTLFDYVERAIGAYKDDKFKSLLRTLNPLFWLSIALDYTAGLPFAILGILGFDRSKMETSPPGKFFKGCLRAAVILCAVAFTLYHLGYVDPMKPKAQRFISQLKLKTQETVPYLELRIQESISPSQDSSQLVSPGN